MPQGVSKFWEEVALAHAQVSTNHTRQITVTSDAESMVAVVMYDAPNDFVVITVMPKTGKTAGREIHKDATDRS